MRAQLLAAGAIPAMAALLQKESSRTVDRSLLHAISIATLSRLVVDRRTGQSTADPKHCQAIVAACGVPALVRRFGDRIDAVDQFAAMIVYNYLSASRASASAAEASVQAVDAAGGVPALAALLTRTSNRGTAQGVVKHGAGAINILLVESPRRCRAAADAVAWRQWWAGWAAATGTQSPHGGPVPAVPHCREQPALPPDRGGGRYPGAAAAAAAARR